MNILTWTAVGVGAGYMLFLLWLTRNRSSPDYLQLEAARGIRELEDHLKQQAKAP
jgi:hypothetical protein